MTSKVLRSSALALAFWASASYDEHAVAQQASQAQVSGPAPAAAEAPAEKIEVTGSYIHRVDTETPSPVQVLSNDDIRRSGFTSLAEVLTNISANGQGTLSQGFSGAFAEGACGIALRGMTVGATLVLLDGHRMAPYPLADDGQRSFVDICQLPLDAVDHVEVLKDGASSTYGSDAIAGVVNVILKKTYQGATIAAENGWSQAGGGQTSHVSGMFGIGSLSDDGGNAFVSLEYRHQDPIMLAQRPYLANLNYEPLGGQNLTPGGNDLFFPGSNYPISSTGYFINPTTTVPSNVNPFPTYGFLPGCNATMLTNNQCTVAPNWLFIVPATQNLNVLARGTKKLGENWSMSLTASLFQSEVYQPGQPFNTSTGGISVASFGPGPGGTVNSTIYSTPGPFVAPVPANIARQFGVPTGTLEPINVLTNDLGGQNTFVKNDTYRLVADVKGAYGGWDLDGTWGWTTDNMTVELTGYPIYSVLYNDLTDGSYVPGQVNSPSVDQAIAPAQYSTNTDLLWFTGAHASRDLFKLPGGPLGFAAGADFFFRSLQAVPAPLSVTGQQAPDFAYAQGSQSDWSLFMELSAPIVKMLEIDGAVRYDHYNTYTPGDTTPKVGFKFTPVQQVALRGTFSKGFRAPNPVESQSSGAGGYYGTTNDPLLCPVNAYTAAGAPIYPTTNYYPNQCIIPNVFLTVSNPQLKPETSISKTLGLILEPTSWFSASVDYFDITLDNQIYPGSEDLALPVTTVRGTPLPQPYVNSAGVTSTATPPMGNILYFDVPYININSSEVKGLDFGLKNSYSLGEAGKLKADLTWSHTLHYYFTQPGLAPVTVDLAGTHGPNEISGDTGNPRNRAQADLTWDREVFEITLTANYISGMSVTDPSAISSQYPNGQISCLDALNGASEFNLAGTPDNFFPSGTTPPNWACRVASFTFFDLYGSWHIDRNWTVHGSIDNLFDRNAPYDLQTYAATNYNPSLHMPGAIGRFFVVGLRYEF